MPQFSPASIPLEVGGQLTITLEGKGILEVGKKKYDCIPGTAFLYRDSNPVGRRVKWPENRRVKYTGNGYFLSNILLSGAQLRCVAN